jgi:hypothetical protein
MMGHICLRDEDLAAAVALPADDPARRRWNVCARCRARVAAFAEFLQPSVTGTGPEWDEADARLAAVLESEILGRPVTERAPVGNRNEPGPRPLPGGSGSSGPGWTAGPAQRFFRWALSPSRRPAAALGVLAVILITIQGIRLLDRPKGDEIILREGRVGSAVAIESGEVKRLSDGALSLSWSPVEGADRYEVVVYGEELTETRRFDAGAATTVTVPAQAVAPLFWRAIAYRGGDVAAQSKIRPLRTQDR